MEAITKAKPAASQLEPVEVEVIHLFVQFSRALGQPRSVAEIYGLLFVSHQPLTLDDLIERLNLSKGSGSQGLKYLSDLGAVRTVYVAGDRRTHYEAVAELRNLAGRFLRREILSHFEDSDTRLDRIADAAQKLSGDQKKFVTARVKTLRGWAQVKGLRGNTSLEERIISDIWYVENWSIFLDFQIMVRTFFRQKNAY